MDKTIEEYLQEGKVHMQKAVDHFALELVSIRTGKANPAIVAGIHVESYGALTSLQHVANVTASDAKTINIQPWDRTMLKVIEKALLASNLGITPMNDGETIRLTIPPLTEERRKLLVKQALALGEEARVSLRSTRHKLMDQIKKQVDNGFPEDLGKKKEKDVEKMIEEFTHKIEDLLKAKEKDILTV
jgi:ribosome recycling factor